MKYKKAFTLIELLVVIAIISLLSAVVLNSLASAKMKANDTKIAQDLRQFRIAAEMYYNDNHTYPEGYTAVTFNNKNITISNPWLNKLSFFIKTAEAAPSHQTPLCANFDTMAGEMVSKKYLSTVPVHPYDNDAAGICYKAVKTEKSFASFGVLTGQVNISGYAVNKRVGFILGDTSKSGILDVNSSVVNQGGDVGYPAGLDGLDIPFDDQTGEFESIDAVDGLTNGADIGSTGFEYSFFSPDSPPIDPANCESYQYYDSVHGYCRTIYTGTRVNSPGSDVNPIVYCGVNEVADLFSDSCIPKNYTDWSCGIGSNQFRDIFGICQTPHTSCNTGSVLQPNGVCLTPSGSYTCPILQIFLQNGYQNTANGTCGDLRTCLYGHIDPVTNTCVGGSNPGGVGA